MIKKIFRLFHTLRYLKPYQFVFFLIRRGFPPKTVSCNKEISINSSFFLHPPIVVKGTNRRPLSFSFLNLAKQFSHKNMDWHPNDVSRLWRYNLHYFDYLREDGRKRNEKIFLIRDWVTKNPQGSQPGWEPFTAGLRIINWIFF